MPRHFLQQAAQEADSSVPCHQIFVVLLRSTKMPQAFHVSHRLFESLFQSADQSFWLRGAVAPTPRLWLTLTRASASSLTRPQSSVLLAPASAAVSRFSR